MAGERAPQKLTSASECKDGAPTHPQVWDLGASPNPQRRNTSLVPASQGLAWTKPSAPHGPALGLCVEKGSDIPQGFCFRGVATLRSYRCLPPPNCREVCEGRPPKGGPVGWDEEPSPMPALQGSQRSCKDRPAPRPMSLWGGHPGQVHTYSSCWLQTQPFASLSLSLLL